MKINYPSYMDSRQIYVNWLKRDILVESWDKNSCESWRVKISNEDWAVFG